LNELTGLSILRPPHRGTGATPKS